MECYKNFVVFYFSVFVLLGCVRIVSGLNNPPRFIATTRFIPVPENTPIGTELFNLTARDTDPNSKLTFGAETDDTRKTVIVEPAFSNGSGIWIAVVKLNATLDRDNGVSRKDLYFTVSDGGYTVKASLAIVITDVNDNPPTFLDLPYRTSVPENFPTNTTLYQFNGTDPDSGTGARIVFSMTASVLADEEDYNATFHLDGAHGVVKLKKSLDYETRSFYHFKVTAKDEGNPPCPGADCLCKKTDYKTDYCDGPTVDFFITVEDVEDTPPVFERLPYHGTVSENQTVNTVILTAKARDGDRAVETPSKIVYSLSGDQSDSFSVSSDGEIRIQKVLDADISTVRERGGLYVFNLTATESSSNERTSTLVSITVTDSNDNAPEFKNKTFFATVLENTPKGAPITMSSTIEVEDIDQSENSQFKISVMTMDGEPDTDFTTIPKAGQILQGSTSVTIIVNNSTILDYETCKNISFKLVAREVIGTGTSKQDGDQRSEAEVHITIEDTNDNSPVFAAGQTVFHVMEDAAIGHVIHTFSATDEDSGAFGRMVFSMEEGQATPKFNVANNGSLMVEGEFQYELQSSYIIVVTATDNPDDHDSQRKTQLQVTIIVDDVNNHAPEWDSSSPIFRIPETKTAGEIVAVLRATDKDDGKNSDLTFSIESNTSGSTYFDVRNGSTSGQAELFIKKNLTGYPGKYTVDVIATDGGDEPRNATLEVLVIVEDINLDPPCFLHPNASTYNISAGVLPQIYVSEGGIHTMQYQLIAVDEGKGTSVFYTLTPTTVFRVNGSGVITNVVPLDRETKDSYKIRVKAEDNGLPAPLSTTLDLIISVTDQNDSDPVYTTRDNVLTTQTMNVIEEVMNPTIGLVDSATDPDLVAHICYYLCDDHGSQDDLILDKRNRSLSLVGKVDREKLTKVTEFITVNVFASSDCDPEPSKNCSEVKTNAQLKITVNVEDVDDNPPRFTPTHIFSRAIPYDKQVNYEVINFNDFVKDPDASPNNEYTFQLKDSTLSPEMQASFKGSNPFRVLKSGSVLTNTVLQADLVGYFKLNIEVNGVNNPTFKDEAEVKIYIVANEQRVRLVFSKLPGEVNATIDPLMQSLAKVLDLNITVGAIQTHTNADGKPDNSKTDAFIYANKKNSDDFMSGTELQRILDYNNKAKQVLFKYGVLEAKLLSTKEDGDDNEVMNRLFVILVTVLSILVIGLLLVLLNIIRMYRRRLKAATTMAYVSPKQQEMYEHPGTNKYYTAENPLFGKEIKAPEIEEDRNSTNSLDVNAVDKSPAKTAYYNNIDPDEEQEVVLQITDSSLSSPHHNGYDQAANQNSRLSKVLEEYDNSVNNNNNNKNSSSKTKPPPPPPTSLDNNQSKAYGIPGLGQDVQEAVTRFSDDGGSRSKSNGYPGTIHEFSSSHGNLEYTEI